jgi:hypothetical protein
VLPLRLLIQKQFFLIQRPNHELEVIGHSQTIASRFGDINSNALHKFPEQVVLIDQRLFCDENVQVPVWYRIEAYVFTPTYTQIELVEQLFCFERFYVKRVSIRASAAIRYVIRSDFNVVQLDLLIDCERFDLVQFHVENIYDLWVLLGFVLDADLEIDALVADINVGVEHVDWIGYVVRERVLPGQVEIVGYNSELFVICVFRRFLIVGRKYQIAWHANSTNIVVEVLLFVQVTVRIVYEHFSFSVDTTNDRAPVRVNGKVTDFGVGFQLLAVVDLLRSNSFYFFGYGINRWHWLWKYAVVNLLKSTNMNNGDAQSYRSKLSSLLIRRASTASDRTRTLFWNNDILLHGFWETPICKSSCSLLFWIYKITPAFQSKIWAGVLNLLVRLPPTFQSLIW